MGRAFRQLYTTRTKFYFKSQVPRPHNWSWAHYKIVSTLPDANGCGTMESIDEAGYVLDFCYRIKPDGTLHGWIARDGEHANSVLPLEPSFGENGEMNAFLIQFSSGYTARYRVGPFGEY